ncbi:type II secretion system minor pseudopilin GspK [Myxococcota bacterium]|nr:type II secretion system minor pseudopilin GspK [Myxococcota bacterium]
MTLSIRSIAQRRSESGVVLLVILFFALLLATSIATFVRRATLDSLIVRNRDAASRADALARGGVRLATALIIEEKLQRSTEGELPLDKDTSYWANASQFAIETNDGASLRLDVQDSGSKLNINALFDAKENGAPHEHTLPMLVALFEKVIKEMDATPADRALYQPDELAGSLIDWVDANEESLKGGQEDDEYQRRDPPYRAANRPLLNLDELHLVDGFDPTLVAALSEYLTVHPYVGATGVNPNTSPAHVLSLLYSDNGVNLDFVDEEIVRDILELRSDGGFVCPEEVNHEDCTPIRELVPNQIFPPPSFESVVFQVRSTAVIGDVERTVESVLDMTEPAAPRRLSWKTR